MGSKYFLVQVCAEVGGKKQIEKSVALLSLELTSYCHGYYSVIDPDQ